LKLKFQTVAEKTAKNFRGLLYFAAPGYIHVRPVCKRRRACYYVKATGQCAPCSYRIVIIYTCRLCANGGSEKRGRLLFWKFKAI